MKTMNQKPNIYDYFKEENISPQKVYKASKKYIPVYINPKLYEEIFQIKYEEKSAFKRISDLFSITLDHNKAKEEIGIGYADKQEDPMGISLSGNQGSGRAYFYGECFNIKGDKTSLATSPKPTYSNGKFALPAAIKEAITANILAKELSIPTFETLAILDTTEYFEYINEFLAPDDSIQKEIVLLPSALEIRVNKEKQLYRVSNALINKDKLSLEKLKHLLDRLALIEAEKYNKRILHGSWSVGNISIDGNLIDFDTAYFVKERNPQYSNTNKYKSNYFGFELLGSKMIGKLLYENSLDNKNNIEWNDLSNEMDKKYEKYLKIEFCKMLGLNYNQDYENYKIYIEDLFDNYLYLSKLFLPNYYDLNVNEKYSDKTAIYDFSNFFKNYLIGKTNSNDILYGVSLLLNNPKEIIYEKVGFIKEKVEEFFFDYLVADGNESRILINAIKYVKAYNNFLKELAQEKDLNEIGFNCYQYNKNKEYIYGNENTYTSLMDLYQEKKIDNFTLNIIINHLIDINIRKKEDKILKMDLQLFDTYLSYKVLEQNYYYYVLVPYKESMIRFAKLCLNEEEYMFHHRENDLISDKIPYENIVDINHEKVKILLNGKINNKRLISP